MAASGEDESHTREQSSYVFLAGHGVLVLGYIFFTVGFATDYWLTTDFGHHGLWERCAYQLCAIISPGELSGWVEGTRAMQTMALMCFLFAVLAGLLVHCVTHTFPPHAVCTPLRDKARVLEIFTVVGCGFCLIGVSVFGGKGKDKGTLGYSFGLTVFSLFLTTIGAVMVAVARSAATSATLNRISPNQPTAVMAVSASSNPRLPPLPQGHSSATYPYGQGHPGADQPSSGRGGGHDGNHRSGRLPPISEVTPSAPPLPPPSGERPPSYLEAIGHTQP